MKTQLKIVLSLWLLVIVLVSFIACKSFKDNEPWDYDEAVWYSENPEIRIIKKQDSYWTGYIIVSDEKVDVQLFWGPSYYFQIVYSDFDVISDETILLRGEVAKFNDNSVTLKIEKDNLLDNKYEEIVLYRRAIDEKE